jgi:hypothetical protein
VVNLYYGRGNVENRIKEGKIHFVVTRRAVTGSLRMRPD